MFKLGCKKDKRDDRDYLMRAYLPVVKIPKKVDYTSKMSPVRNQGQEGTCVGFATTVGMKEYQEFIDYGIDPRKIHVETQLAVPQSGNRGIVDVNFSSRSFKGRKLKFASTNDCRENSTHNPQPHKYIPILSPRFLYNECKKLDGHPGTEGTEIRIAMKVLKNYGVCREQLWPYVVGDKRKPTAFQVKDAAKNKELSYARILDLDELRLNLAAKGPCVIGIVCFSGIMRTKTGKVPMPKAGERPLGGHAICPVGYDDAKKLIKFKNSWSAAWGDKGYGYLPYGYINKFMMDAWSTVDIKDASPLTIQKVIKAIKN